MDIEKYILTMLCQEIQAFSKTDDIIIKKVIFKRIVGFVNDIEKNILNT